jgi:hypothetical protein
MEGIMVASDLGVEPHVLLGEVERALGLLAD